MKKISCLIVLLMFLISPNFAQQPNFNHQILINNSFLVIQFCIPLPVTLQPDYPSVEVLY